MPDTLDGGSAAEFLQAVEVSRKVRVNTWGNDELAYTAEELFQLCHDPYEWYVVLVVRLDGARLWAAPASPCPWMTTPIWPT